MIEKAMQRLEWAMAVEARARGLEDQILQLHSDIDALERLGVVSLLETVIDEKVAKLAGLSEELERAYTDPIDPPVAALRQVPMDMIQDAIVRQIAALAQPDITDSLVFQVLVGVAERWNGRKLALNMELSNVYGSCHWNVDKY